MNDSNFLFDTFGKLVEKRPKESLATLDSQKVMADLKKNGTLLFRGFDANLERFGEFSDQFSHDHLRHGVTTLRNRLSNDGTIVDVLKGTDYVDLHGEMFYLPKRPDVLWLMCTRPADEGGATTVCDGVRYLNSLPKDVRKLFESKSILYRHQWTQEGWQSIFNSTDSHEAMAALKKDQRISSVRIENDLLCFNFTTSAIEQPKYTSDGAFINSIANIKQYEHMKIMEVMFADGMPISTDLLDIINQTGESITYNVDWQSGDILMIENSRILHGRRAFSGARTIATRFSKVA